MFASEFVGDLFADIADLGPVCLSFSPWRFSFFFQTTDVCALLPCALHKFLRDSWNQIELRPTSLLSGCEVAEGWRCPSRWSLGWKVSVVHILHVPSMPTLCAAVLRFQELQGQEVSVNENTSRATTAAIAEQELNALCRLGSSVARRKHKNHKKLLASPGVAVSCSCLCKLWHRFPKVAEPWSSRQTCATTQSTLAKCLLGISPRAL